MKFKPDIIIKGKVRELTAIQASNLCENSSEFDNRFDAVAEAQSIITTYFYPNQTHKWIPTFVRIK